MPVLELVADAVKRRSGEPRPVLVWIRDELDERTNQAVEGCLAEPPIGMALQRFHCFRAAADSVPDARMQNDLLRRAPILLFLDPEGTLVSSLDGRRATSRSGVAARLKQLWDASYELPLKNYLTWMDDILYRKQELERLEEALERKKDAAADKPQKLAALKPREAEIENLRAKVAEDEKAVAARCRLRPPFRPEEPEENG